MSASAEIRAGADRLAAELAEHGATGARLAFVLGSGLGAFADRLEDPLVIPGEALENLPKSAVPGHAGRIIVGSLQGARVLVQQGRVHLYEGWSAFEVTRAVRAFARLGVRGLVLTNAAGGLRAEWPPGTLMRVVDHLNLQGRAPLLPDEAGWGVPYDSGLGNGLDRAAEKADVALAQGVYAALLGPTYETPSEIRMLARFGADAVGMSTVAEAAAARAEGLRVAAVSCITNPAAGLSPTPLSHDEVVAAGKQAAEGFRRLLTCAVPELLAELGAD